MASNAGSCITTCSVFHHDTTGKYVTEDKEKNVLSIYSQLSVCMQSSPVTSHPSLFTLHLEVII